MLCQLSLPTTATLESDDVMLKANPDMSQSYQIISHHVIFYSPGGLIPHLDMLVSYHAIVDERRVTCCFVIHLTCFFHIVSCRVVPRHMRPCIC